LYLIRYENTFESRVGVLALWLVCWDHLYFSYVHLRLRLSGTWGKKAEIIYISLIFLSTKATGAEHVLKLK